MTPIGGVLSQLQGTQFPKKIHIKRVLRLPGATLGPKDWGDTDWGVPWSQLSGAPGLRLAPKDWGDTDREVTPIGGCRGASCREPMPPKKIQLRLLLGVVWRPKIGVTPIGGCRGVSCRGPMPPKWRPSGTEWLTRIDCEPRVRL